MQRIAGRRRQAFDVSETPMNAAGNGGKTGAAAHPVLKEALSACRGGFSAVIVFSLCINILMLTAPIYMLQIFDRVIVSRSTDTLLYLTIVAAAALLTLAVLEGVRNRIMVRLGAWVDDRISSSVLGASITGPVRGERNPSVQGLRDLSTVRTFLTGSGIFPILDAPWTPIFLAVIFLLHPFLGFMALGGAIILFSMAVSNEVATRKQLLLSGRASRNALSDAEAAVRNANVIEAMGMLPNILRRWRRKNAEMLEHQATASARAGAITAASKFVRQGLQIGVLGVGAWLALQGELTAGAMIAASILMSRALAPVEMAIGSWKSAIAARAAYDRVRRQLAEAPRRGMATTLPAPEGRIRVEGMTFYYPGTTNPTIRNVNFQLEPGEALGLIGATAAGKSTLAGLLVGNLAPRVGNVRLDGADVAQWEPEDRGQYIGYLPQDIELFSGTIRENIARMGDAEAEAVIAAAQLAGVHEMVLKMPQGYETEIGDGGAAISGGQRQRIALARAVFGTPRFVVLDEPNASLDGEGEQALLEAIEILKSRGVTLIVIAHRPSILRQVDKIMVLKEGMMEIFGARDEVIPKLTRPGPATNASRA